jgi:hypothetical protein
MYKGQRRFMLAWIVMGALMAQSGPGGFTPVLEIPKPVYLLDESIRFRIGVNADLPIPEGVRSSCVLHWVRPDATAFDEQVPWPLDGDPTRSWRGGWGFGKERPEIGRYTVSFEFAGRRTAAQSFEVISDPFADRIAAHWIFTDTKSGGRAHTRSALLHVENKTGRKLRFAKPGLLGSEVWLEIKTFQPPAMATLPVPQQALLGPAEISGLSYDRLDWDNQSTWPMIEAADGGSVDRPVALGSAYPFREGQEYEVTIHTVLTVFAGERGDSDAGLFPLQLPVSATAHFRW